MTLGARVQSLQRNRSVLLVAGIAAAHVTILAGSTLALRDVLGALLTVAGPAGVLVMGLLAVTLATLSLVVAPVVLGNTYAVIAQAHVHELALRRLLGASAAHERRRIRGQAAWTGLVGGLVGAAAGLGVVVVLVARLRAGVLSSPEYVVPGSPAPPGVGPAVGIAAILAVVVTIGLTVDAAERATRDSSAITPLAAVDRAVLVESGAGPRPRTRVTAFLAGSAAVVASALLGVVTPLAILPALVAGVVASVGFVRGSERIVTVWLDLVDRVLPSSPSGRLAARRIADHPARSARSLVGIVISVAVVVSLATARASASYDVARVYRGTSSEDWAVQLLTLMSAAAGTMLAATVSLTAVGLCQVSVLGSLQRRRENGLMRILGQSRSGVRRLAAQETARLVGSGVGLGLLIGVVFGWAGAQALLGAVRAPHLVLLIPPTGLLLVVAAGGAGLTLTATLLAVRPSLRDTPLQTFRATGS